MLQAKSFAETAMKLFVRFLFRRHPTQTETDLQENYILLRVN